MNHILKILLPVAFISITGCHRHCMKPVEDLSGIPEMEALYTDTAITLDGRMDEEVWRRCPVYGMDLSKDKLDEGQQAEETGQVRLAWDKKNFYLGIKFTDSSLIAKGDVDNILHAEVGDVCNFFLRPVNKPHYWEFYATPRGKMGCLFFSMRGASIQFDKDFDLKVKAQNNGTVNDENDRDHYWTAEIAVPIKDLTSRCDKFGPNEKWRIFTGRYNYSKHLKNGSPEYTMTPQVSKTSFHLLPEHALLCLKRQ